MAAAARLLLLLVVATALSLAMVLFMAHRQMGEMGDAQVNARYLILVARQSPAAQVAGQVFGNPPPPLIRRLAVVWDHAHPFTFWWLPPVLASLILILGRFSRRRVRRGT